MSQDQTVLLAFSTVACPQWSLDRVIAAAGEYGYQGVELRTFGSGSSQIASDPALSDPEKVRQQFESSSIAISCLATSVSLHCRDFDESWKTMEAAQSYIDLAAGIGAPLVRFFGYQIYPGESKPGAQRRVAGRLTELAEYAVESGVQVLIENAGAFSRARDVWQLMALANHPLVGVCWNVANAATVGEGPGVSVTTLNHHLRYTKLKDTVIAEGTGFTPLGEGTVEVERFVELMRGIGYTNWMCFEWDKLWLPSLEEPENALPQAVETLREWMRVKVDKKGKVLSKYEAPALEVKAEG